MSRCRKSNRGNEYDDEFAEIWQGTFGKVGNRHEPSPRNNRVGGICVRALFAPDHAPKMEIMKQLLKARERIDFAIFTFARSSGIDGAVIICGSFNYTGPANRLNDENILVIGDLEDEGPLAQTAQRDLATFALAEIDRMIATNGERVPLTP